MALFITQQAFSGGLELIKAAKKGDIAEVKLLITSNANVNAKYDQGRTALMNVSGIRALGANIDIVKLLIESGADVNAKDNNGKSALPRAKRSCLPGLKSEVAKILIATGAKE